MPPPLTSDIPLAGVIPYASAPPGAVLPRGPGLLPGSSSSFDWADFLVPSDDQGQEPSCVGRAWAGWLEAMLRRHLGLGVVPRGQQIDARAIWLRGRKMFFGGDHTGGLHLHQGGEAAIDLGILPRGTRIVRVEGDWSAAGEALAFTPLIQSHAIGPGWLRPDVSGCVDHSLPPSPERHGWHATLLCERTVDAQGRWMIFQNSWGPGWGFYGLGVLSAALWSDSLMPGGLWTAILPSDWAADRTWRQHLVPA